MRLICNMYRLIYIANQPLADATRSLYRSTYTPKGISARLRVRSTNMDWLC